MPNGKIQEYFGLGCQLFRWKWISCRPEYGAGIIVSGRKPKADSFHFDLVTFTGIGKN